MKGGVEGELPDEDEVVVFGEVFQQFGVVADDGVFEDGFAGAGFAEDEAEPALLAVDLENVEVALLVFEERGVFVDDEGVVAGVRRLPLFQNIVLPQILASGFAGHVRFYCTHADVCSLVVLVNELG